MPMQHKPQPQNVSAGASATALQYGSPGGRGGQQHEGQDSGYQDGPLVGTRPGKSVLLGQSNYHNSPTASASVGLYATPSYSSMYNDQEDSDPGPGSYDIPSNHGHQHLSTHHSQPSASLTAKHDASWSKVMISKDHLNAIMARGTPGPGSYVPEPVPTQAAVRFGTAKRRSLSDSTFRAPGPVYENKSALEDPEKSVKFSKANRFDADNTSLSKLLGSTGPGQYEVGTAFDGQRLSKSFGASHRAYDRVRFPGSDRIEIGRASPGPGSLQPFQNSNKSNAFSRAERLPIDGSGKRAPGPGAYEHDRPNPTNRTQSCYSFGRPSAKGRMDWKQMRSMTNSVWGVK